MKMGIPSAGPQLSGIRSCCDSRTPTVNRINSMCRSLSAGERQARCGRCGKLLGEFLVVDGTIRCPRCKLDNDLKMKPLSLAVHATGDHMMEAVPRD